MTLIPAAPGWRIVLADRENSGSVALPIVAWERFKEHHQGPGDYDATIEYLRAWYVPNETGAAPRPLDDKTLVCGYLAPGEEHEPFWDEVAENLLKAEREHEDREHERRHG